MPVNLRILYKDPSLVAIDKPAGFHVHPPEDSRHQIPHSLNCLSILNRQLNQYLYPVHRLDRATSGVLVFALNPEAARSLSEMFSSRSIEKTYLAVVRGWLKEDSSVIDIPLRALARIRARNQDTETEETEEIVLKKSMTQYQTLSRVELPYSVGKYSTARYTLVQASPLTGRMHQIRRHFAHLSHPLIGDSVYGDGKHNRFFREILNGSNLLLKAYSLRFPHPVTGQLMEFKSKWNHKWHQVFELFGVCPY